MKQVYSLIAQDAIEDKTKGTWSVIHVFDSITAGQFPVTLPNFVFFTKIEHEEENLIDVIVKAVEGQENLVDVKDYKLNLEKDKPFTHVRIELAGLSIEEAGEYVVQVLHKGDVICSAPLTLNSL